MLAAAHLASNAELAEREGRLTVLGDPTEGALKVAALKAGLTDARIRSRFTRVGELPFSAERKLMSTAHADAHARGRPGAVRQGRPRRAARALHFGAHRGMKQSPLDGARRDAIARSIDGLAGEALRTLGIAYRALDAAERGALDPSHEEALVWLGVVGMIDPPRPEAKEAVAAAQKAGLRVLMITGDHPAAAAAIAAELGIAPAGGRR